MRFSARKFANEIHDIITFENTHMPHFGIHNNLNFLAPFLKLNIYYFYEENNRNISL